MQGVKWGGGRHGERGRPLDRDVVVAKGSLDARLAATAAGRRYRAIGALDADGMDTLAPHLPVKLTAIRTRCCVMN